MENRILGGQLNARPALISMLLATTTLTGASSALAATSSPSPSLEIIVVTAEKRSEDLQKVPFSILALGTEKLDELHVTDFNDYAKFLPSVAYQTAGPGFAQVYMRGVASGENGNHSGPLPSVGMYLDEQPITTIGGALDIHVYDIARVESLAGPQGTLYGASSQAGTIRIITNKPDPSGFSAAYDVGINTVDHGGIGYSGEGYANIPLTDKMAIRLVGWEEYDAGYIDNVAGTNIGAGIVDGVRTYPTATAVSIGPPAMPGGVISHSNAALVRNNYNTLQTFGGRAALQIDLDDNWTITPSIIAQSGLSRGSFAYDPAVGDLKIVHFLPEKTTDNWVQAALTIQGKISDLDVTYAAAYLDRSIRSQSDYADYSFFYDVVYNSVVYDDSGNVIDPTQSLHGKDHFTKASHELRFASPQEDRLRFIAGLFTQRQTHAIEQRYIIPGLETPKLVTGWPDTIWLTEQMRIDRDYAVFTEISYDVTPQLKITGGARGFIADNTLAGFFGKHSYEALVPPPGSSHPPCLPVLLIQNTPCTNINNRVYERGYTHKLNATYQINDDDLVYATWSTGFRPGGVNRNASLPPYHSDYLTNYELGWKTSWLDQSLRFNGAIFWEDWDGIQFSTIPPGSSGLTQIFNAGKARILGVESNVDWRATDNLTLTAAATYIDAELMRDYCQDNTPCAPLETPDAAKGTNLPVTPRFKANAVARYEWSWDEFVSHLQGAIVYQTSAWPALIASDRAVLGKLPAYTTVDLAAGVVWGNWSAELSVENAFDERGINTRFTECPTQTCAGQVYSLPIQPRVIGLKIGQKF